MLDALYDTVLSESAPRSVPPPPGRSYYPRADARARSDHPIYAAVISTLSSFRPMNT